MIHIDGNLGEGGGQILRTSLSLAAITGEPVTVDNIRASRDKPGLRSQHLTGALAVARICSAEIEGAQVGSTRLTFKPGQIESGEYEFDVAAVQTSAGSVNLIVQTIIWPLAFGPKKSRVVIKGGTHVPFAPTSNYISEVFLPVVARMGLACRYSVIRSGYYPSGGGEVRLEIPAVEQLKPISATQRSGQMHVDLTSAVSNLPVSIAQRQLDTAKKRLCEIGVRPEATIKEYPSQGKGTVVFICCYDSDARGGFQGLGALKKRAERVSDEACDEFEDYYDSNAAFDKYLADQLIIPAALADGLSEFTTAEVTSHLLTNISIVEAFLPVKFRVGGDTGTAGRMERVR